MGLGLRGTILLTVIGLSSLLSWAEKSVQGSAQVFVGEITDSYCAKSSSRAEFLDQTRTTGHDKKRCAMKCIRRGSRIVLYDTSRHAVYKLDDPEKVIPFAGQRVRITGTLHNNEITVETIENIN